MGKVSYTHEGMIDLIIMHPEMSQGQLAAHFGYSEPWISNILASDAFQAQLAKRREEIVDPVLKATMEERCRALVIRSQEVLMKKLSQPVVSDVVALKAYELGCKSIGIGGHAPPPRTEVPGDRLTALAERLILLQSNIRKGVTLDGQSETVIEG